MTAEEALELCDAYLDGELDSETKAAVERHLAENLETRASFDAQREFNDCLKRRAESVSPSPDFLVRLQQSIARPVSTPPAPLALPARRGLWQTLSTVLAACVMLGVGTFVYLQWAYPECPYLVSCVKEHTSVALGSRALELTSGDPKVLASFAGEKVKAKVQSIGALPDQNLRPVGATVIQFKDLKAYNAPKGVLVAYETPEREAVSLILHPWPNEEPEAFTKTEFKGRTFWAGTHGGRSVACWKGADGNTLISAVSSRSQSDTVALAYAMSQAVH